VSASSEAMKSTPHIYLSALAWTPEESVVQKRIVRQFKNVEFIGGKPRNWDATR
jgi:hypothetical protein